MHFKTSTAFIFNEWELSHLSQNLYARGDCVLMAALLKTSIFERETQKKKKRRQARLKLFT